MKKILLSSIVLSLFALSITLFELSCNKTADAAPPSPSYALPVATTSRLGGVIPDGTTITVDGNGKISTAGVSAQQQNKIILVTNVPLVVPGTSGLYQGQIWSANYDGSNLQQINITLPAGVYISYTPNVVISPDKKTIFFTVADIKTNIGTYSCNIDGSNPKAVIAPNVKGLSIEVAY